MINLRTIVETTLVPHDAFEEACRRLNQCFEYALGASEPICLAIVGESRTGKSRALEECFVSHPKLRDAEGLTVPILRVKTPSKPTVKSLAELMLRALSDPRFDAGTENAKTIRLQTLMQNCNTVMVMIDEFQHFYDKGSHKVMHHVADWLKTLVDDSRVALVVAGLPSCQAVLDQNEQLAGRFLSPVLMPRFDWNNDDQRTQFIAILGAFHESLGSHFDLPTLDTDEMAFRCYCATGGLIGYLTKLLRQTVWNALDTGTQRITLANMAVAHDESIWSRNTAIGLQNPFTPTFSCVPSADIIASIKKLGVAAEPPPKPKKRNYNGGSKLAINTILSAS